MAYHRRLLEFHGEFYDIPKTRWSCAQPIPILVGGHADAALRRRRAPMMGCMAAAIRRTLDRLIARVKRLAGVAGENQPVPKRRDSPGFTRDGVKLLEDKRVTDVIVGFVSCTPGPDTEPLQTKIRTWRCSPRTSSRKFAIGQRIDPRSAS